MSPLRKLTKLKNLLFIEIVSFRSGLNKCYKNREVAEVDKVKVSMISIDDLILNKKATGRSKDKEDIENLNKNSLKGFSR